jgi:hypothetical protein
MDAQDLTSIEGKHNCATSMTNPETCIPKKAIELQYIRINK